MTNDFCAARGKATISQIAYQIKASRFTDHP